MPSPSEITRSEMTAIEAIVYCLGEISNTPEDGRINTRVVYDRRGERHWIAWNASPISGRKDISTPRFASESPFPFIEALEPYTAER